MADETRMPGGIVREAVLRINSLHRQAGYTMQEVAILQDAIDASTAPLRRDLAAARAERDAERARADRAEAGRDEAQRQARLDAIVAEQQYLGLKEIHDASGRAYDNIIAHRDRIQRDLDTSAAEVASLLDWMDRADVPQFCCPGQPNGCHDFEGHPATKPDACSRCGGRWTGRRWLPPLAPIGAPLAGKPEGGTP